MEQWNEQIEEELTLQIKEWLKVQGKTQKDLKKFLNTSSDRMPVILETLKAEYFSGGLPRLANVLCAIEEEWAHKKNQPLKQNIDSDPFSQLDLLLEEIKEDCSK